VSSPIECPICLHMVDWGRAPLVTLDDDLSARPLADVRGESQAGQRMRVQTAYRACEGQQSVHYLPNAYGDYYENRIIVGVIGDTAAGKTHLLAAMIGQFMRGTRLRPLGLQVDALDLRIHRQYLTDVIEPFLDRHQVLPHTPMGRALSITDALLVTSLQDDRHHPVAFFDVAGEELARADPEGKRFLGAVNALLFVVDPQVIRGVSRERGARSEGDPTFDIALGMLKRSRAALGEPFLDIPAAVVVAKADMLRGHDPRPDRWLQYADAEEDLDLSTLEEESRDVFTYLFTHDAERWLDPAEQCSVSTLHFASASGTAPVIPDDGAVEPTHFPDARFRPRRVLKPLLSLLQMKGVRFSALTEGERYA
jgi:hypothetical protein